MIFSKILHIFRKIYSKYYLYKNPILEKIIQSTNRSISTGIEVTDYIYLYNYIKKNKPKKVLECGTGKSTFIIAAAMKEYCGKNTTLISMESEKKYHLAQKKIFPFTTFPFVKILYSPIKLYNYSFISGTGYSNIPNLKYDFIFIDGPLGAYKEKFSFEPGKINIDFLNVILKNKNLFINGVIDNRKLTTIGYSILFGKSRVYFHKFFNLGIIKNASFKNLKLKKGKYKENHFESLVKNINY